MEIGSEFHLEEVSKVYELKENLTSRFKNIALTSSGRGAIALLLDQINPKYRTVLMPSYICESVIQPFAEKGYQFIFYDINIDLMADPEETSKYKNIGVFLHMGYFGFPTNSNLANLIRETSTDTVIVEDITHTMLSDCSTHFDNDFVVGSVRKWIGIPSGGFLASAKHNVKKTNRIDSCFSELRLMALLKKREYINSGETHLKEEAREIFAKAEAILDQDAIPYEMDELSMTILESINEQEVIKIRRSNFEILGDELSKLQGMNSLFRVLPNNVCPLFHPVYIFSDRNRVQKELAKKNIYCPVHWPVPAQVHGKSEYIYKNILSIPCDQRFGASDMGYIVSVLKEIMESIC